MFVRIHHAGHFFPLSQRQLGVQCFRAEINFHRRQFRLRLFGQNVVNRLRRGGGFGFFAAGQQDNAEQQRQ